MLFYYKSYIVLVSGMSIPCVTRKIQLLLEARISNDEPFKDIPSHLKKKKIIICLRLLCFFYWLVYLEHIISAVLERARWVCQEDSSNNTKQAPVADAEVDMAFDLTLHTIDSYATVGHVTDIIGCALAGTSRCQLLLVSSESAKQGSQTYPVQEEKLK